MPQLQISQTMTSGRARGGDHEPSPARPNRHHQLAPTKPTRLRSSSTASIAGGAETPRRAASEIERGNGDAPAKTSRVRPTRRSAKMFSHPRLFRHPIPLYRLSSRLCFGHRRDGCLWEPVIEWVRTGAAPPILNYRGFWTQCLKVTRKTRWAAKKDGHDWI